jgi:ClpP class serine protease
MWLLANAIKQRIEQAFKSGFVPDAKQQLEFETSRAESFRADSSRIMVTAGNVAEIVVEGMITAKPSFMAMLFGGGNTTFPEIISALAEADMDPNVTEAILKIDSPGSTVAGLFETLAAIDAFSKPLRAVVTRAESGAFALAAKAGRIEATSRASMVGSVGVVVDARLDPDVISITSTDAPDKRPDLTTEEGRATVRAQLDEVHQLFAEALAEGRGTTVERVNAEFGRGTSFFADQALRRGMIDSIAARPALKVVGGTDSTSTASSGGDQQETGPMDLNTLKAEHPAVYAAAVGEGRTEGIETGTAAERDRVSAFLAAGEMSGDMKTAVDAIKSGEAMTQTHQMTFMMAAANRSDTNNRQSDSDGADAGDGAGADDESAAQAAAGDAIIGAAAAACNVEMEA